MQNVSPWRRLGYTLIDVCAYTTATLLLGRILGWNPPPIAFMQSYSGPQREAYWAMLGIAAAIVFAISITGHALYGRSIGKWLLCARTVEADGSPLGVHGSLRRLIYAAILFAAVTLPGPLIAFASGHGSEPFSALVLIASIFAGPILALVPVFPDRAPLMQTIVGVRTILAPRWPI